MHSIIGFVAILNRWLIQLCPYNGTGVVIKLVYIILLLIYAPKKVKIKIFSLLMAVVVTFTAIALISIFALCNQKMSKRFRLAMV